MRIAIDLRPLQNSHSQRGIGRWLQEFVLALGAIDTQSEYVLLWEGPSEPPAYFQKQSTLHLPHKIPGLRWLSDYVMLPIYLQMAHADLYLATDYMAYPHNRSSMPVMSVVYDFLPLTLPNYKWRTRLGCRLNFSHLQNHQHVFMISDYTLREASHYLDDPLPEMSKIGVGVNHERFHLSTSKEVQQVCNDFHLSKYFIYVGESNARKNIKRIMEALDLLEDEVHLVLVGKSHAHSKETQQTLAHMKHPGRVRILGYVPDEQMRPLISGAQAMVFPSLAEGFGFPVIEAMACGTPVITSNQSSLPEAAGNAALLVDPASIESIKNGMQQVLEDVAVRKRMKQKGRSHTKNFSWKTCAEHFIEHRDMLTNKK